MNRTLLCLAVAFGVWAGNGALLQAEEPAAPPAASGTRILDDFESYPSGDTIGESAKSKPWKRFGEATMDNVAVTSREGMVLSGKQSAQYPVAWPNRFGMVRYVPDAPIDLSKSSAVTLKIKSSNPQTRTKVFLSLTNGKATIESRKSIELGGDAKELTFELAPGGFQHVDGDRDYTPELILESATEIGFKLVSGGEGEYKETILFDDVSVAGGGS